MLIAGTSASHWFTRFGEFEILVPLAAALALWITVSARSIRPASSWLVPLGLAAALTILTKLAFAGWGIGIASIDFTCVSGHAMFSAAIYPVLALAFTAASRREGARRPTAAAVAAAYAFAALVAYSRIRVHAHSWSEVIVAYGLGAMVSGSALWLMAHSVKRPPLRWAGLGLAAWLVVMPLHAAPSRTQGLVTRIAMALSERERPFTRADLHRREAESVGKTSTR